MYTEQEERETYIGLIGCGLILGILFAVSLWLWRWTVSLTILPVDSFLKISNTSFLVDFILTFGFIGFSPLYCFGLIALVGLIWGFGYLSIPRFVIMILRIAVLVIYILTLGYFGNSMHQVKDTYYSTKVASYIVPTDKLIHEDDGRSGYKLATPKSTFVNKHVLKSNSGYTQIDGHTFIVNNQRIHIANGNNIIRHRVFDRNQKRIEYITYSWKNNTPEYIINAYEKQFGELNKLKVIEIFE